MAAPGEKIDEIVDGVVAPDLAKHAVDEKTGTGRAQTGFPKSIHHFVLPLP
jgi:hypothetical protein